MILTVAGIDPSLRNTGLAKAYLNTETMSLDVFDVRLIHTEKRSGKSIRVNSDDLRCGNEIVKGIHDWIEGCHMVFAEIPSGGQSAAAAKGLGLATGILSTIGVVGSFKGRLVQTMPSEVKMAACGSKVAAKTEMIDWAQARWPAAPWLTTKRGGVMVPTLANEHLADAAGAINAGLRTNECPSLISMLSILPQ